MESEVSGTYPRVFKPLFDRAAAVALIILMPLLVVVAVLLAVSIRGNPFFVQPRGGYQNCVFRIIKYRTMTYDRHADGTLKSDMERLTRVGRVVRNLSVDELPQLLNVLKGDMSLGHSSFGALHLACEPKTRQSWSRCDGWCAYRREEDSTGLRTECSVDSVRYRKPQRQWARAHRRL